MRRGGRRTYKPHTSSSSDLKNNNKTSKKKSSDCEDIWIIALIICSIIFIFVLVFTIIHFTKDIEPQNKNFEFLLADDKNIEPEQTGILARFKNISPYEVELWWYTPHLNEEIRSFGHISSGKSISFTTYTGHTFFYSKPGEERDRSKRMKEFKIRHYRTLYIFKDEQYDGHNEKLYKDTLDELWFLYNYYKRNGKHWISPYNRARPRVPFIKNSKRNGYSFDIKIDNDEGYWICDHGNMCRDKKPLTLTIEQINYKYPRMYMVRNFIHKFEAQHILNIAKKKLSPSMIGNGRDGHVDPTRRSMSCWLSMNRTQIFATIYKRLGIIFNIDKQRMTVDAAMDSTLSKDKCGVASHLEVEFFDTGGFYESHFDNDVSDEENLNFITAQIVLDTSYDMIGGDSFFRNGINMTKNENKGKVGRRNNKNKKNMKKYKDWSDGLTVKNEKYNLLFWYNMLPDGNLDEHTMYANNRVMKGHQYISHMTVWDPCLPRGGAPGASHEKIFHDEL